MSQNKETNTFDRENKTDISQQIWTVYQQVWEEKTVFGICACLELDVQWRQQI